PQQERVHQGRLPARGGGAQSILFRIQKIPRPAESLPGEPYFVFPASAARSLSPIEPKDSVGLPVLRSENSRASSRSSASMSALRLRRILLPEGSTSRTATSTSLPMGNVFFRSVPREVADSL